MKKYIVAEEVANLVKEHDLLADDCSDVRIRYLFNMDENWTKLGQCSLATGKWKHLTGLNYAIEINYTIWHKLDDTQKKALIAHELKHICFEPSKDGTEKKWKIRHHDVEEFIDVVKNFGCWSTDLKEMGEAIKGAMK